MGRAVFFGVFIVLAGCAKDQAPASIDRELYLKAKDTAGFVWYAHNANPLGKSAGSGHAFPFLRTRFNAIAAQSLDSTGKIAENILFTE